MQMDVKFTGMREVKRRLDSLDKKMSTKYGKTAVRQGGKAILEEAKIESAKKHSKYSTGRLRRSIASRVMTRRDGLRSGVVGQKVGVRGQAYYWRFLEFGTKKMSAKPFLRPAYERKKNEAFNIILDELKKAL